VGWKDGVSMQGLRYTYSVTTVNAVVDCFALDAVCQNAKGSGVIQSESALSLDAFCLVCLVRIPVLQRTPLSHIV
jgi:hypothetical protein